MANAMFTRELISKSKVENDRGRPPHVHTIQLHLYTHQNNIKTEQKTVKLDRGLEIRVLDGTFLSSIAVL